MRTLIDISEDQIEVLAEISRREGLSRASLLRRAIREFIARRRPIDGDAAFGSWRGGEDGLAYEMRVRSEW